MLSNGQDAETETTLHILPRVEGAVRFGAPIPKPDLFLLRHGFDDRTQTTGPLLPTVALSIGNEYSSRSAEDKWEGFVTSSVNCPHTGAFSII